MSHRDLTELVATATDSRYLRAPDTARSSGVLCLPWSSLESPPLSLFSSSFLLVLWFRSPMCSISGLSFPRSLSPCHYDGRVLELYRSSALCLFDDVSYL